MITEKDFCTIKEEIEHCIKETLDTIKNNNEESYVLLLARADYDDTCKEGNPYKIDCNMDLYAYEQQHNFMNTFMKTYYNFQTEKIEDDKTRIILESMIYLHIWEAKYFLKLLYRISNILNDRVYDWSVKIGDKSNFIRKKIRNVLNTKSNNFSNIIKKGYFSHLRNAIAHAQYNFNPINNEKKIYLTNCSKEISFDQWSERFVYSFILYSELLNQSIKRRRSINKDLGKNIFKISQPVVNINVNIVYGYQGQDVFNYESQFENK